MEITESGAHSSPYAATFPASHHGIVWVELSAAHVGPLANLVARIEARDNPPYRTSPDEIEEMLAEAGEWFGIAGFATRGIARGRMVAWSQVTARMPGHLECLCQGGVDPSFRRIGLGGALVAWLTESSRRLVEARGEAGRAQIVMNVDPDNTELEEHLRLAGYHWARTYYEMRADLAQLPADPPLSRWLTIEEWAPQWEEPARRAANRLSEEEWGRPPLSEEQWLMGRTAFASQWSFLAVDRRGDRPRVAGFLLASRYEQDWAALGWKEGYIDQMGVLREWRHTQVVDALVLASMRAQRRDGMDRTGVGLGSANHSGALAVYDSLGFRTVGQTRLYAIEV